MKKVTIYTGDLCIHCDSAKDLLNRKNIQFIEHNIVKDSSKREEMLKKSNGARTVPQIFIGDQHVGGNVELQKLDREGKLDSLVSA
jgi:glutaredoxin 3